MLRTRGAPTKCIGILTVLLFGFGLGWFFASIQQQDLPQYKPTSPLHTNPPSIVNPPKPTSMPTNPPSIVNPPTPTSIPSTSPTDAISRKDLEELATIQLTNGLDVSFTFSKPVDIMLVWKHNSNVPDDFAKVYDVDPDELKIYHEYLLPSLRKCKVCAFWLFSHFNFEKVLNNPPDFPLIQNQLSLLSTFHYQKHVLGYSNLTLFSSIDDTVSFDFWENLETWITQTKPQLEEGEEYCVYPAGQHFVFPFESPMKCVKMEQIWGDPRIVLHLMIGIQSRKFYSPQFLDHAQFRAHQTTYNCKPIAIPGHAYYMRRKKSHASLTHQQFYNDVLRRAKTCTYDSTTGKFDY